MRTNGTWTVETKLAGVNARRFNTASKRDQLERAYNADRVAMQMAADLKSNEQWLTNRLGTETAVAVHVRGELKEIFVGRLGRTGCCGSWLLVSRTGAVRAFHSEWFVLRFGLPEVWM